MVRNWLSGRHLQQVLDVSVWRFLTASGHATLQLARKATQSMSGGGSPVTLSRAQQVSIIEVMQMLQPLFT